MAQSPSRPVGGRYQQYKRGTHKIVEWLWTTAQDTIKVDKITIARTPTGSIGIKGLLYLLTYNRLLKSLAEIVSQKVKAAVPTRIVELLQEVISARKDLATWYSSQPCSVSSSNEAHRHFIAVLQQVYKTLLPCCEDRSGKIADRKLYSKSKPLDIPVSAFACLAVEEPSESPLGREPSAKLPSERNSKSDGRDLDLDDGLFSVFEVWCFLVELRDVRKSIVQTWIQYSKGEVSALVATNVLEVGFGLARIANENLNKNSATLSDWWKLLAFFGLRMEQIHGVGGVSYLFPKTARPEHLRKQPTLDPTDLICPAAAQTLREIRALWAKFEPDFRSGRKRLYREAPPVKGSHYKFPLVLVEMLPNLCYFSKHSKHGHTSTHTVGSSEFLQAIMKYFRTGALPVWFAVAFQTYCEVFEVIGSDSSCIAELYLDRLDECEESVSAHEAVMETTPGLMES